MKRREFLRMTMATSPLLLSGCAIWPHLCTSCTPDAPSNTSTGATTPIPADTSVAEIDSDDSAEIHGTQDHRIKSPQELSDEILRDQRSKSSYYSQNFPDDIYFRGDKFRMLQTVTAKFRRVQKNIGFGNFNLIGMDDFFLFADKFSNVGAITPAEKLFLEELFYFDASRYGFTGKKVLTQFTAQLKKNEALKIPYTGHFLKRGESLEIYNKVRKDIGESLVLTSGMRAMAKQFHLFMEKGLDTGGNMSKASRSLAPPGYSFHGRGDFDVGKVGYGLKNFTDDFASTDEYKRLLDLGYINIRYTQDNLLGVRFEPWHIQIEG